MLRAAVKLLVQRSIIFHRGSRVPAASRPPTQERPAQAAAGMARGSRACAGRAGLLCPTIPFASLPRGSGDEPWVRAPALVFYPGSRGSRGPQRLCSLNPDTSAAAPSSWRSRETTQHDTVRAARVRRVDDPPDLRDFQDRARGDHVGRDIPPQRDHQLARDRHNANSARALPLAELLPIPLRQGAERLPAHPVPG